MRFVCYIMIGMLVIGSGLGFPRSAAAQAPTTVTLQVHQTTGGFPVAGVTLTLVQTRGTVSVRTDTNGEAVFSVPAGGFTLLVEETTATGLPLQLDPFYEARGGLPVFVTPAATRLSLLVDDLGLVTVAPLSDELRETGSQASVPLTASPMAPVGPLVTAVPTVLLAEALPTVPPTIPRPTVPTVPAVPAITRPTPRERQPLLGIVLLSLAAGAGALYWFVVRPRSQAQRQQKEGRGDV